MRKDDIEEFPIEEITGELAQFFAALGEPKRMEIVESLWYGEANAGDLATALEIPLNRLSYHLRVLEKAGVIEVARRGRHKIISLKTEARAVVEAAVGAVAAPFIIQAPEVFPAEAGHKFTR